MQRHIPGLQRHPFNLLQLVRYAHAKGSPLLGQWLEGPIIKAGAHAKTSAARIPGYQRNQRQVDFPEPHVQGADRLRDPKGHKPNIWFQVVPEGKASKNRMHFDLSVGGGRSVPIEERTRRVDARVAELVPVRRSAWRASQL